MLIHSKDDIEFVTEFPCFLAHPVSYPSKSNIRFFLSLVHCSRLILPQPDTYPLIPFQIIIHTLELSSHQHFKIFIFYNMTRLSPRKKITHWVIPYKVRTVKSFINLEFPFFPQRLLKTFVELMCPC